MNVELIGDVFAANATATPSKVAINERGSELSYSDMLEWTDRVTRVLEALGIGPGGAVGLMAPNSAAFVAGFFGVARAGAVVAPLSVRYRSQELQFYLADATAGAIIVDLPLVEIALASVSEMMPAPAVVAIDRNSRSCEVVAAGTVPGASAPSGDLPLLHQYTSGSTGRPKRVVRTHTQLVAELGRLASKLGARADDRFIGIAPFSHVNGLVRSMMHSMFLGATLYPMPEFRRREAIDIIHRERISYFGAVPHIFVAIGQTALREAVDFSSLRILFSSSAPLLADDNRTFHDKYSLYVRQLYGSTETGTMSVNMDPSIADTLGSVGTPLEGVRFEIWDEAGRPVPATVEGDIVVASETAITGYAGNPEATAKAFSDGFYLTGDLGYVDEDGRLYLNGRKKFLINRSGFKINPLEVEMAIQSHPSVVEVVVYGVPAAHGDEAVACAIVASAPTTVDEIIGHCEDRIADFKIPGRIEFRDELPKSISGKILRDQL